MSSKRIYNVFFNLHTVSGIVVSVALYIIFLAGAFSLFKEDIKDWEYKSVEKPISRWEIDYDRVLHNLDEKYDIKGRDLQVNLGSSDNKIKVYFGNKKDSLDINENNYFIIDVKTLENSTYENQYNLGEFLYRLHFFHQIPYIGVYIAGILSLFLLFALGSGIVIHWKKIVSNFYTFQPKQKLKRVWSSAHTALGVLGLPFQFIMGLTGAYFCLNFLVLAPALALYQGNQNKLMEDLLPEKRYVSWENYSNNELLSFNKFVKSSSDIWDNFELTNFYIKNYGGSNSQYILSGGVLENNVFNAKGRISYNSKTNNILLEKSPYKFSFVEDFQSAVAKLHFGSYGGILIKIIYFFLSIITCFVIISGVLLWVESRNKKNIDIEKRIYTTNVGHVYTAICLSMLPVTAASFIFVKLLPVNISNKTIPIYLFYFTSWFALTCFLRYKRDHYYTNRFCLLTTSILGFLIPIIYGVYSYKIFFEILINYKSINTVNGIWLVISAVSLYAFFKIDNKIKKQSSYYKTPLLEEDYQNNKNQKIINKLTMQTKIIFLWIIASILWVIHHMYGLFNVYYVESLIIEGADGNVPIEHHMYRVLFEGLCLLFAILSIQITQRVFLLIAFTWAILAALYNLFHFVTAIIYESENISEIFMLTLMVIVSSFLLYNYYCLLFKDK